MPTTATIKKISKGWVIIVQDGFGRRYIYVDEVDATKEVFDILTEGK